ncbi:hypothetical protein KIW84_063741 [Lathyrus oleraceus]|uniref:Uncharacterized protein n=1 Tax=Pisum sativum TaxID=3888 RepID=A0A9D4W9Q2_PEA|nr:hypothetical protein KIW84_063741 [Pisum sativum]
MGRHSCCYKQKLRKGLWSPEEDEKLLRHITKYGHGCWSSLPKQAELEDSIRSSIATKIKLETLMKVMMEEEKKEVLQGGDANEATGDEDYDGEDDTDAEKEDEGGEYEITNSDSQEDI